MKKWNPVGPLECIKKFHKITSTRRINTQVRIGSWKSDLTFTGGAAGH